MKLVLSNQEETNREEHREDVPTKFPREHEFINNFIMRHVCSLLTMGSEIKFCLD